MLPAALTPEILRKLELMKIRSRRAYLGSRQGGHVSPKRGHGIEFADFRQYELGDSPRWIDWGVYARTDRLYVRRYQEDQNLSILIIVDTSASMTAVPEDKKWQRAIEIACAIAYVGLMEQDSVYVAALGRYNSPQLQSPRAIHSLAESLLSISADDRALDVASEVQRAVSRIRFPGIAVFISDMLMPTVEIRKIFSVMMAKNLDISALQLLGREDIEPLLHTENAIAVDSESGQEIQLSLDAEGRQQYKFLLEQHSNELRNFFTERRIGFFSAPAHTDLSDYLGYVLAQGGILAG